jgi:AcrR family transcriptional regulator
MTQENPTQKNAGTSGPPAAGRANRPRRRANNARKELVREELLDKAADLFSRKGLSSTSINDIADALSLKRSSIYYYFKNKEEIIREIFLGEYERRVAELSSLLERDDLSDQERLTAAIEGAIAQRLHGGSRFIIFDRLEAEAPAELRASYNRCRRQILDYYTRIIEDGVRSGAFRPVDAQLAAFAVIGMANWTALWFSPRGSKTPRQIAVALSDLVVRGLNTNLEQQPCLPDLKDAADRIRECLKAIEALADPHRPEE